MSSLSCASIQPPAATPNSVRAGPRDGDRGEQARHQAALFVAAATRALVQVYDEDSDDNSLLTALIHQLDSQPELCATCANWRQLLTAGLARANHLARMAAQLRALRRAHRQASIDQLSGALSGVDLPLCTQALAELAQDLASTPAFVITVEPWGPITLAGLRRLCRARAPVTPPEVIAAPSQSLLWPEHG